MDLNADLGETVGGVATADDAAMFALVSSASIACGGHAGVCDVGDRAAVDRACAEAEAALGPVDVLVNNAGISPKRSGKPVPVWEMDGAEWDTVVAVNLTGCFNMARRLTPGMVARKRGWIVNMASVSGRVWTPLLAPSAYPEPDSVPVENGGRDFTFPHALPADPAEAAKALPGTPWMDELTLEAALAGADAMGLGRGPATDVLAVSLSSTDAVGHTYGMDSRMV